MTVHPSRIEYNLGTDQYGRRLRLMSEGKGWKLHRAAYNQRDEEVFIELSRDHIRLMAEIVK